MGISSAFVPFTQRIVSVLLLSQVWLQYGVNSSGVISLDFFAFDATTGESKKKVRAELVQRATKQR